MFLILVLKMYFPKTKNDYNYSKLFLLQPSRVTTILGLPYYIKLKGTGTEIYDGTFC